MQYNEHHDKDVFAHSLCVVDSIYPNIELRLAALFHDIAKPKCFTLDENNQGHFYEHAKFSADMTRETLIRLKFDNKTIDTVCKLIFEHMTPTNLNNKSIKKLIQRVGENNIYSLLALIIADRKATAKDYRNIDDVKILEEKIDKILNEQQPMTVKDLKINGYDIVALGYKGKEIGDILNQLLEIVLEEPEKNDISILLNYIKLKQ
jgi:tRNA nucleotidyltransferase (CCA-adding enzyme)